MDGNDERVPLTDLLWSPRPGVVLEITATDDGRSISDLIALTNETTTPPVTKWEISYTS